MLSFIDFEPYKNIFSNLLTYAGNLQHELGKYVSVKAYTPYRGKIVTPEETDPPNMKGKVYGIITDW